MMLKGMKLSDIGRRILYKPPYRDTLKKGSMTEYSGILVDYDSKYLWIMCDDLGKDKFKVAPICVTFKG